MKNTKRNNDLEIKKMMRNYRMTVEGLISMIQKRGLIIPTELVMDVTNGFIDVERTIILYEDKFFLILSFLSKHFETCCSKGLHVFDTHKEAQDFYKSVIIKINKQ